MSARDGIVAAAAHAFAEHGYHGVSMRDLARTTGRSLATFYSHFASKEALLYSMQRDAFDTLIARADAALAGIADPVARLEAFLINHLRYFAAERDLMRVLIHEAAALPARPRDAIRKRKLKYFALARHLVGAVMAGARPLEVERATYCAFGMLNWTYAWYEPDQHGPPDELARTIHVILMSGLVSRASPRVHQ